MSHAEVCVKNDPIHAVVAAAQQILIESAQPIRHGRQVTDTPSPVSNCPAGATFSQLRLRKSVARYLSSCRKSNHPQTIFSDEVKTIFSAEVKCPGPKCHGRELYVSSLRMRLRQCPLWSEFTVAHNPRAAGYSAAATTLAAGGRVVSQTWFKTIRAVVGATIHITIEQRRFSVALIGEPVRS